jgi:penicillin-insensitive murein endopeptidase
MAQRIFWLILATFLSFSLGCGPSHKERGGQTTFVTHKPSQPDKPAEPDLSQNPPSNPQPQQPQQQQQPVPVAPLTEDDGGTVAPLLTQDEHKAEVPAYEMPEILRQRIRSEMPEYFVPSWTSAFQVTAHQLNVNVKNSTMTFTGTLKIPGRADEKFELRCKFDKSQAWSCSNMFPTDPKVAAERRLQATANCADLYRCDQIGIELFVRINGRTESQMFQSNKFSVRRASSGDVADTEPGTTPVQPRPGGGLSGGVPPVTADEPLTDEELRAILDDSNSAVEITGPIPVPPPTAGEFSIPEIERLRPTMGEGVANQAIGVHSGGRLKDAAQLPKEGPGYAVRSGPDRSFGTDSMVEMIRDAAAAMEKTRPNRPKLMVADIAQKYGGRLSNRSGRYHASHQTGLDADISFPSNHETRDLWPAFTGGKISERLDEERLWSFLTAMTCAEQNPVIAIFVDTGIKQHLCRWAKTRTNITDPNSCAFKTLRALKYSPGHHDHMHVRLRCPGNRDCRNATVTLGRSTGC